MGNDIFVGSVAVGVVPDARGWNQELRSQLVPSADQVGEEVGRTISKRVVDNMGKAGTEAAGAFDKTFRARLKAALESLPKAKLDADATDADRKVAELRARMEELLGKEIGVDISSKEAMAEILKIDTGLEEVRKSSKDIKVTFDTKEARAQLALLRRDAGASSGGGVLSSIGGLFGGAGAAAPALATSGAPAAAESGGTLSAIAGAASSAVIPVIIGAIVAAAPFIAQAIGGTIIFALGAALVGVGAIGAIMSGKLTAQFSKFTAGAKKDLISIGAAFIPVLSNIMTVAGQVLNTLTPVFKAVMGAIAGPFRLFVDTILKAFTQPAVVTSIKAVGTAFGAILTAFTPDIPGIFRSFAQAITAIAQAISKNPKAFADFLNFLAQVVIFALRVIWVLTLTATWLETHFLPAIHQIAVVWDATRHEVMVILDQMYSDSIGRTIRFSHNVEMVYNNLKHWILSFFSDAISWLTQAGQNIMSGLWNGLRRGWNILWGWYVNIDNWLVGFFRNSPSWLVGAGKDIISGLYNGIRQAIGGVSGWIKSVVVDPIITAVKHWFGIKSPAASMFPVGFNVIQGIFNGMVKAGANLGGLVSKVFGGWPQALGSFLSKGIVDIAKLPQKALSALGSVAGKIGGFFSKLFGGSTGAGVSRWAGTVAQALAMLGLPISLAPRVLYQMQTESGGNPNAINNTDINAQMGDPSRGLLQTIGATFMAYHVPGTSMNIYDPLANIAAAINYAAHTYGPGLMRGGMGMGSGHGYDTGGWLPPGVTMAVNNTRYPELVVSHEQLQSGAYAGIGGSQYHAHFDGLTGAAIESHVRTAFQAMSLAQGNLGRQGRRS